MVSLLQSSLRMMLSKQCACNTGCSMFTIWIGCTQIEDKPRQKAPVTISHVSQESFLASYQKRCRQKLVSYKKEQLKGKSKFSSLLSKISEKKIVFDLQHLKIFNLAQKTLEKTFWKNLSHSLSMKISWYLSFSRYRGTKK